MESENCPRCDRHEVLWRFRDPDTEKLICPHCYAEVGGNAINVCPGCADQPVPGVLSAHHYTPATAERCDTCDRYPDDITARDQVRQA